MALFLDNRILFLLFFYFVKKIVGGNKVLGGSGLGFALLNVRQPCIF